MFLFTKILFTDVSHYAKEYMVGCNMDLRSCKRKQNGNEVLNGCWCKSVWHVNNESSHVQNFQ